MDFPEHGGWDRNTRAVRRRSADRFLEATAEDVPAFVAFVGVDGAVVAGAGAGAVAGAAGIAAAGMAGGAAGGAVVAVAALELDDHLNVSMPFEFQ